MAGGPSTVELVVAATEAGGFGFLAAGYKTAGAMAAEITAVRAAGAGAFGVNVFVPQPAADPAVVAAYLATLAPEAAALGVALGEARWDDDGWEAKIDTLLADPPPLVSFTFGCPPAEVVAAFRQAGTLVAVTVTTPEEAAQGRRRRRRLPVRAGHRGRRPPGQLRQRRPAGTGLDPPGPAAQIPRVAGRRIPLIAAGGIAGPAGVAAVRAAGAAAVQVGTAFLRCPESGAHPVYKAALADPRFTATAVTRAFSGRPARGLVNRFLAAHPGAPAALPRDQQRHPAPAGGGRRPGRRRRPEPVGRPGLPIRHRPPRRRDHGGSRGRNHLLIQLRPTYGRRVYQFLERRRDERALVRRARRRSPARRSAGPPRCAPRAR